MINTHTIGTVLALVFGGFAARLGAETVVLQPGLDEGKDISLYERTDVEVSSSKSLFVINTGPPGPGFDDFTSLMEFDLSDVPVERAVAGATLRLYESNVPTFSFLHVSPSFSNTIAIDPAASGWAEANVFFSTLPEPVPGYQVTQTVDGVDQWFSWDLTAVVRDWLSGKLPNHGLLVNSLIEVRDGGIVVGSAFDASEQQNSPMLEIELMSLQPGDYNRDGIVDLVDYSRWKADFGSRVVPAGSGADGNANGQVDAADYTVWRDHLQLNPQTPLAASLPEPQASVIFLWLASVLCLLRRGHRMRRPSSLAALMLLLLSMLSAVPTTSAVTIPFTEDFATGSANWRDFQSPAPGPVSFIATGGIGGAGDGYISIERTFADGSNLDFSQTVFRGQDGFDASGDAFVGNWLASGVTAFSFWIRHDAPQPITFGTRFATSANSPGANGVASPGDVPPNLWTFVELPISPAVIRPEGPPSLFDTVFTNVGNLQVSARPSAAANLGVPITFDLDHVAIVPEPQSLAHFVVVLLTLAAIKRPR